MSNRQKAIDFIINFCTEVTEGKAEYLAEYRQQLEALSDDDFKQHMQDLKDRKAHIRVVIPNGGKYRINRAHLLEVADKRGYELFHHLVITDPQTKTVYQTPKKYLCIHLPVRRQAQLLKKKQSIPEDNKHHDQFTDQATGVSKGAKISFPEAQMLSAQNADKSLQELFSFRGGDLKAYNFMRRAIFNAGGVSHATLSSLGTRAKATDVFSAYLTAMHLDNTL